MPAGTMEAAAGSPRSRRPLLSPQGPPPHPVSPRPRGTLTARPIRAGLSRRRHWLKVTRVGGDTEHRLTGLGQTQPLPDPPGCPRCSLGVQEPPRAVPATARQRSGCGAIVQATGRRRRMAAGRRVGIRAQAGRVALAAGTAGVAAPPGERGQVGHNNTPGRAPAPKITPGR